MDENDISSLVDKIKTMVDNGDFADVVNSINNNSSNDTDTDNSSNQDNSFASSIDVGTILKMKSIIDSMNKKDDPRANLLYSLKPYLRDSRKGKLDQYVNLLNMTKIADVLKKEGGL